MKLILSSCDFHNPCSRQCILDNLDKPLDRCRVLFVPNETASRKAIHSGKFHQRLHELGFSEKNITVLDYYEAERYADLDIDLLYVSGGNTFQIIHRLRKHHFDEAIVQYVKQGVTYIGGSAGAHIVSKDISHVLAYDTNPNGITDFRGLALFNGILICHFCEERRPHYEELRAKNRYPVYPLTNDDSLVIET